MQYFEGLKDYNIIANTFANSGLIVIKAIIGIMPLLIAFTLLGMCFFVDSNRFGNISLSMFSLYSLMNGDSPFDIWYDVQQNSFLTGTIYMYIFIFISTSIIANVFVVIIGDAYVKSKYFQQTDWIKPTDELGNVIIEDEDAEDPLEPFENKTQQEIDSRKALVKMLQEDKELLMKEYYKGKYERKKRRKTEMNSKIEEIPEEEDDDDSAPDSLAINLLNMSAFKYLTYLANDFERDMKGDDDEQMQKYAQTLPHVVREIKEDVFDRCNNCFDRIYEALDDMKVNPRLEEESKRERESLMEDLFNR